MARKRYVCMHNKQRFTLEEAETLRAFVQEALKRKAYPFDLVTKTLRLAFVKLASAVYMTETQAKVLPNRRPGPQRRRKPHLKIVRPPVERLERHR